MSGALGGYLGVDGLTVLLTQLSLRPLKDGSTVVGDMNKFVDIIRRLQTLRYEEASRRFGEYDVQQDYFDANEVLPYLQESLVSIIQRP